jgi:hypothetical protein
MPSHAQESHGFGTNYQKNILPTIYLPTKDNFFLGFLIGS